MRLLSMKKEATNRFRRDPRGGCHGAKRYLLLHHTLHHGRPLLSGKTVCRVLWPWTAVLDHRRRRASLSWFLRSLAGAEPFETVCPTGIGRGEKLVTEDSKPVGSGRFRVPSQDFSRVLGRSFSSSLSLSEEGCVAQTHGGIGWGVSRASCSAEAATGNALETHPCRQENPLPCSSFTPIFSWWRNGCPKRNASARQRRG